MILKASQRAGAAALATHLLNTVDNDHVAVHQLRGFLSDTLHEAFREIQAQSLGTRCEKYLFSLSLSPPETESVQPEVFEKALEEIEDTLGLTGQPRAVVFHEKEGRRHAHCVWSRIDAQAMKAIPLPHFKLKLQAVAMKLYQDYGWEMPKGFTKKAQCSPLNFELAEWHQAKRLQEDPKALKALFQDCWKRSDNGKSFTQALKENGFILAKGDKRGVVAVDYRGEVFSLSRWIGVKAKELTAKLGSAEFLPSVAEAKNSLGKAAGERLKGHAEALRQDYQERLGDLKGKRDALVCQHQDERKALKAIQTHRWKRESDQRKQNLPKGLQKFWGLVTGQLRAIQNDNARDVERCKQRDAAQQQALIDRQREERQSLQQEFRKLRAERQEQMNTLRAYVSHYAEMRLLTANGLQRDFNPLAGRIQDDAAKRHLPPSSYKR